MGDHSGPPFLWCIMDAAAQRIWRAKNPEKVRLYNQRAVAKFGRRPCSPAWHREYHLKRKYGLSAAAWEALFTAQGRRCAGCRTPVPGKQTWHTDHAGPLPCTPAQVRGILCCFCNHALGKGDLRDIARLRGLIHYAEKFNG